VRQILGDTETEQGHIEPQKQIPEVAERERCRGTENLKREWETDAETETDTVRDKDRCRGTQKLKKECDADRGRQQRQKQGDREPEKRVGDWDTETERIRSRAL
jgi:hypothetical protein